MNNIQNLDFNSLTETHKRTADHIAKHAENLGMVEFADTIRKDFGLVKRKTYKLSDSPFVKKMEENDIFVAIQGFTVEDDVEYPIVAVVNDIRNLNKLFDEN
jgi:hypothetical protein